MPGAAPPDPPSVCPQQELVIQPDCPCCYGDPKVCACLPQSVAAYVAAESSGGVPGSFGFGVLTTRGFGVSKYFVDAAGFFGGPFSSLRYNETSGKFEQQPQCNNLNNTFPLCIEGPPSPFGDYISYGSGRIAYGLNLPFFLQRSYHYWTFSTKFYTTQPPVRLGPYGHWPYASEIYIDLAHLMGMEPPLFAGIDPIPDAQRTWVLRFKHRDAIGLVNLPRESWIAYECPDSAFTGCGAAVFAYSAARSQNPSVVANTWPASVVVRSAGYDDCLCDQHCSLASTIYMAFRDSPSSTVYHVALTKPYPSLWPTTWAGIASVPAPPWYGTINVLCVATSHDDGVYVVMDDQIPLDNSSAFLRIAGLLGTCGSSCSFTGKMWASYGIGFGGEFRPDSYISIGCSDYIDP